MLTRLPATNSKLKSVNSRRIIKGEGKISLFNITYIPGVESEINWELLSEITFEHRYFNFFVINNATIAVYEMFSGFFSHCIALYNANNFELLGKSLINNGQRYNRIWFYPIPNSNHFLTRIARGDKKYALALYHFNGTHCAKIKNITKDMCLAEDENEDHPVNSPIIHLNGQIFYRLEGALIGIFDLRTLREYIVRSVTPDVPLDGFTDRELTDFYRTVTAHSTLMPWQTTRLRSVFFAQGLAHDVHATILNYVGTDVGRPIARDCPLPDHPVLMQIDNELTVYQGELNGEQKAIRRSLERTKTMMTEDLHLSYAELVLQIEKEFPELDIKPKFSSRNFGKFGERLEVQPGARSEGCIRVRKILKALMKLDENAYGEESRLRRMP